MIKTLKSELKLRPTYDEMIGMIEEQDKKNRPPIEKIIDRRATLFRNNQFGSQFDNIDFLGLKKQEEDKLKQEKRNLQLRQIGTGSSMGALTSQLSSGFTTPAEVYDATLGDDEVMTQEEAMRIRQEMETYLEQQQQANQASITEVMENLSDVHRQSLPVGVDIHRMDSEGIEEVPEDARVMQPSSSSSVIGSAIASGAKAVGGAVLDAGKEAVKEAVVAGARSAVMSLI